MNGARASTAPSLVANGLTRGYGSGAERRLVIDSLSLDFRPGELSLMMGASGSGKSTLLAMLSGLLRPEAGHVEVFGTALWQLDDAALERFRFAHFGFIFQGFNLFPALTAVEQVALPLRFSGVAAAEATRRARQALDEVGLSARSALRPAQLSGGEKQRVAIARALAGNPQLLFADEPTSALDSSNSEAVIALLQRVARQHAATVIVVTHDPRLQRHGDRLIELRDGAVIRDERPAPSSVALTGIDS